jgi:hypothetical protein
MIVVQNLMDEFAWPIFALHYRQKVEVAQEDRMDDQYRLWLVDHAMHGAPVANPGETFHPAINTRIVSFQGVIEQALLDVSAWVERGLPPPADTAFEWRDGQVHLPTSAVARKGVQPTVEVSANGAVRADVRAGQPVEFAALVEAPPGTGTIVSAEWDFDGSGEYRESAATIDGSAIRLELAATHAYAAPGTYFPALRVASHRRGDTATQHARIENLGRVRVVVT